MKNKGSNIKVFAFVFSFEEVNTNVFVNALMRHRRSDQYFVAYCPKGFQPLFFNADLVIEIPDGYIKYQSYSEVSETRSRFEGLIQMSRAIGLDLLSSFRRFLKPQHLLGLGSMLRTLRTHRYLYASGAWGWVQKDAKSRWGKAGLQYGRVIHVSGYFVITPNGLTFFRNLEQSYRFRFRELADAIEGGMRIRQAAVEVSKKQVVIRTRNYASKAIMHNSDSEETLFVTRHLLRKGYNVINVGSPPLKMALPDNPGNNSSVDAMGNYLELASPSLVSEIDTILESDFVVTRADAGLFTLMALVDRPLVTISAEWSTPLGVTLMESRANSGQSFSDLNLDASVDLEGTAASRLDDWLGSSNKLI